MSGRRVLTILAAAGALQPPPDRWAPRGPAADRVEPKALSRFLTQRAVQQQLYYFALGQDRTSHAYLAEYLRPPPGDDEDRTRSPPLDEDYHGVDALPTGTSRDYLCCLLEEPNLEITIKKEMGCGGATELRRFDARTGQYINRSVNPYLKKRYHSYNVDIRPQQICRQLFAIREQVAGELVADLRELPRVDRDLARARALYEEDRPSFDDSRQGDASGARSSPFRAATYELALQLCTAFAVESVLSAVSDKELERTWRAHKDSFFRHNAWTRGLRGDAADASRRSVTDMFVSDLVLATRPSLDGARLESPADAVLVRRCSIAAEWADALKQVPHEHLAWDRWALESSALDPA